MYGISAKDTIGPITNRYVEQFGGGRGGGGGGGGGVGV